MGFLCTGGLPVKPTDLAGRAGGWSPLVLEGSAAEVAVADAVDFDSDKLYK